MTNILEKMRGLASVMDDTGKAQWARYFETLGMEVRGIDGELAQIAARAAFRRPKRVKPYRETEVSALQI